MDPTPTRSAPVQVLSGHPFVCEFVGVETLAEALGPSPLCRLERR
jgi:hypothetical protein